MLMLINYDEAVFYTHTAYYLRYTYSEKSTICAHAVWNCRNSRVLSYCAFFTVATCL